MLTIEIKLNGRVVAEAAIENISDLAEVSDYRGRWAEHACPELGIEASTGAFRIRGHRRRQSAWALAAKAVEQVLGGLVALAEPRGRKG